MKNPFFSIVMVNYNAGDMLFKVMSALSQQTYSNFEVVVIDNHSMDNSWQVAEKTNFPCHLVHLDKNIGFAADHIAKLVQTIGEHPDIKVIYNGARCLDENNNPHSAKFTPFDSTQLIAENYIPIHTALSLKHYLIRAVTWTKLLISMKIGISGYKHQCSQSTFLSKGQVQLTASRNNQALA